MKERFEGANHQNLIDALKRQEFVGDDDVLAEEMATKGELVEFQKLDKLIVQGKEDNDIFLLTGSVSIVISGNEYKSRQAGHHVGEMAAIEPTLKRSATVVANETVVALKVSSAEFMTIGKTFPQIWLPMSRVLSRRLHERNDMIQPPNDYPKLFIISSSEAKPVAEELRRQLEHDVFSTVWSDGVFFAGAYTLEALEKAVSESDFAVAIAQSDDVVRSRNKVQPTLRDNVLFELGLFMGKLTRHRAILIHPKVKNLKLPSDLQGLTLLSYPTGSSPKLFRTWLGHRHTPDLASLLKPSCDEIRKIVKLHGVRKP